MAPKKPLPPIDEPTHFRRIKKRLTDHGLELPEYATHMTYWRNRELHWTNGSTLDEVAAALGGNVDPDKLPLTLVRKTDLPGSYYYHTETFALEDIRLFAGGVGDDPAAHAAKVLRSQNNSCVRLSLFDPAATIKRLRAISAQVAPALTPGDELASLVRLFRVGHRPDGWKGLMRALALVGGHASPGLTHAELSALSGERTQSTCTQTLSEALRCESCEPAPTLAEVRALDPKEWAGVSELYKKLAVRENSRTLTNLTTQVEKVLRVHSGTRPFEVVKTMAAAEREALLALAETTALPIRSQLLRQQELAQSAPPATTPTLAGAAQLLAATRRKHPGRTVFTLRCSRQVLKGTLAGEDREAFEGVDVYSIRNNHADLAEVVGHHGEVLAKLHLPPSDLTGEQGAIYSQLRADGVEPLAAKEMALLV